MKIFDKSDKEVEWGDEGDWGESQGASGTWPLGEIIGARHDLLHSKIFNS